jgi:anti-sigma factor RsiW
MGCKFDERLIHLYADGELGANARERVEEHLRICDDCRAVYESIMQLKSELITACAEIKAPDYLRSRVISLCGQDSGSNEPVLNRIERFKLKLYQPIASRSLAIGFVIAAILIMVFIPGRGGLNSLAAELAQQHKSQPGIIDAQFISTSDSHEVESYLNANLEISAFIPSSLPDNMTLKGVKTTDLGGIRMAHVRYSDGKMECSLFIYPDIQFNSTRRGGRPTMMAVGTEFEISSSEDVNFVCWHKEKLSYILCGCCCFEKLTQLAASTI